MEPLNDKDRQKMIKRREALKRIASAAFTLGSTGALFSIISSCEVEDLPAPYTNYYSYAKQNNYNSYFSYTSYKSYTNYKSYTSYGSYSSYSSYSSYRSYSSYGWYLSYGYCFYGNYYPSYADIYYYNLGR